MRPTSTNARDSAKSILRDEIIRALDGPHRPFSDYLADYRKRFDSLHKLGNIVVSKRISELAKKSSVFRAGLVDCGLPLDHPILKLARRQDFLSEYAKRLKPKDLQEQGAEIRHSIDSLSRSIGMITPCRRGSLLDASKNPLLASYFESAEKADKALTPKTGASSLSVQMAKAAIPKLVEFANTLGNVTDFVITMKATTDTGETSEVEQRFTVDAARLQLPCAEPMEPTRATCNGNPVTIMVPKALNRGLNSGPIEIGQPQRRTSEAEEVPIGAYARKYVKTVDPKNRTIVFRGRSHATAVVPPDSDMAWKYMMRLIESADPHGWVRLEGDLDAKWNGHFKRTDKNGNVITKSPLTNLLCRIESNRKRGRPKANVRKDAKTVCVPMIRLASFNKDKFKEYAKAETGQK